jgi:hypothetical protein
MTSWSVDRAKIQINKRMAPEPPRPFCIRRERASVAGASRPVDDVSVRGHEAFPHQRTSVAVIIVVVVAAITEPGAHTKSERTDLSASAAGAGTQIHLRGSRRRRQNCSRCQRGEQNSPHGHSSIMVIRTSTHRRHLSCLLEKFICSRNPGELCGVEVVCGVEVECVALRRCICTKAVEAAKLETIVEQSLSR